MVAPSGAVDPPRVASGDRLFAGSIPEIYESHLVPLIFEPCAADLASRLCSRSRSRVLEVAAGTGVVTRALARELPETVAIVATDLNQAMLEQAQRSGTCRAVQWRQADAMRLPFGDETFDTVVCQFGVMFFPNKPQAFSEARRVLKPGGTLLFNVWDRLSENEFADAVTKALESVFPADPPCFLARTPHGYCDECVIRRHLAEGGFSSSPQIDRMVARSRAASCRVPAVAYCQGTPLRNEIEARNGALLDDATDAASAAISRRFGPGPVDGKISAYVIAVER